MFLFFVCWRFGVLVFWRFGVLTLGFWRCVVGVGGFGCGLGCALNVWVFGVELLALGFWIHVVAGFRVCDLAFGFLALVFWR